MRAWREWAPGVAIQIPPNLESRWDELLDELDDLGGISWAKDEVNPTRPWEKLEQYQRICEAKGRELVERLPVYRRLRCHFSPLPLLLISLPLILPFSYSQTSVAINNLPFQFHYLFLSAACVQSGGQLCALLRPGTPGLCLLLDLCRLVVAGAWPS